MYKNALEHFKNVDTILYNLALPLEPIELNPSDNLFLSLCREIAGQQLSGKAARTIFERFTKLFPEDTPTPNFVLKISDQQIRDAGMSWGKVRFIKDLSEKIVDKSLDLEQLRTLDNEAVALELTKIKGIGPWTVEMFQMFALAQEDVFSLGDLGLKNAIKKWYPVSEKPTSQELLEISRKWSPYRTYASLILWNSLDNLNILV